MIFSKSCISPPLPDPPNSESGPRGVSSFTGPKGVLADYKSQFHLRESSASTICETYVPRHVINTSINELYLSNFLAAIEDERPTTTVIIHVYEPDLSVSQITNALLEKISQNNNDATFYKIQANELSSVMFFDPVALPALLVYVDHIQTHCLLRITDHIPNWNNSNRYELQRAFEKYLEDEQVF